MSVEKPTPVRVISLLLAVILVTAAACLSFMWNTALLQVQLSLHLNDLGKFYYDAQAFVKGAPMYGPSPATAIPLSEEVSKQFLNLNPPHLHLILLPFASLNPVHMLALWLLSGLVCVAEVVRRALRATGTTVSPGAILLGILLLTWSAAFGSILATGQVTMHLLPLIAWAWLAARRQRWNQTAIALGLAISVKPFLLIMLPWLAIRGRLAAAVLSLGVVAGCFAVGLAVFGADNHAAWLASLSAIDWYDMPLNASLRAFLDRTLQDTFFYQPPLVAPGAGYALWFAGFLAIGLASMSTAILDRSPEAVDRAFCILTLAALLMCPLGWVYYVLLALPPAIGLLGRRNQARAAARPFGMIAGKACRGALIAACVLIMVPTSAVMAGQPSGLLTVTLGSAHFWAVFLFWISTFLDGLRSLSIQDVRLRELVGSLGVSRKARPRGAGSPAWLGTNPLRNRSQ